MRKLIFFVILIFAVAFLFPKVNKVNKEETKRVSLNMQIASLAFQNNTKIPSIYTCDGKNINPPLQFLDIPNNTKSLVLVVDDPDAPSKTASNAAAAWVHWVVYNINPKATKVDENSIPQGGTEGMTDFGSKGYGGPCPPASPKLQRGEPSGTHRYFFKLYALDAILDLPKNATKQMLEQKMQDRIIAKAELIGLYSRR